MEVNARSTCSCTVALLSNRIILPDESGEVILEYNTKGRKGFSTQNIYIRTNDADKKEVILTMSATIKTSIKVVPDKLWLDEMGINEEVKREILVIGPDDETLKVDSIKIPNEITTKIFPSRNITNDMNAIPILLTIK